MSWTIVRPTAFFKSVSGQLESIQQGNPYVLFGDGAVTRCNPIAEEELAEFMIDSIVDKSRHQKIFNIGGPDRPLTNQMLGEVCDYNEITFSEKCRKVRLIILLFFLFIIQPSDLKMMFKSIGMEPKFVYAPTWIFDIIIDSVQFFADLTKNEKLEDIAEVGRIGKYYAVEDMLTTEPDEKYGKITMQDHYDKIANMGQDPFTPV